jgi:8-oxo-dGTP pyrophosphatase MutT (NUDIX family)
MESERAKRIRSFLIGGIVGSAAGLVAAGRMRVPRRPGRRDSPAGLAAFEQAPCYAETLEREAREEAAR